MELHRQAIAVGLARGGEAGQLDFLSLANRARMRGKSPGALLVWLLRERKTAFITLLDEEAGARRLREHYNGSNKRSHLEEGRMPQRELSGDEQLVEACILAAKKCRVRDPFKIARQAYAWTREQWDVAKMAYDAAQARCWADAADELNA